MKNKILIIIGREFNERVRKKSFIITTLLTPLLMIGLMLTPMLVMNITDSEQKNIVVVDDSGIVAQKLQSNDEVGFEPLPVNINDARKQFTEHFAILHIGENIMTNHRDVRLYTNSSASIGLEMSIASQIENIIEGEKLKRYTGIFLIFIIEVLSIFLKIYFVCVTLFVSFLAICLVSSVIFGLFYS